MTGAPRARRADGEGGLVTIQYVFAVGISFVLLVLVANLLVDLYARAAVRDALEEGTRAAVPVDASANACGDRAQIVLQGLLRGPIGDGIRVRCRTGPELVAATADVRLRSWLPGLVPDWTFTVVAGAVRDALEEGTRAAVPIDAAPSACAERARAVLHGLLRGPIGRDIRVHCDLALGVASATAEVRLHSWLPGMAPDWKFTVRSVAVRDR